MTERRAWKFRPGSDEQTVRRTLESKRIRLDYNAAGIAPSMTIGELGEVLQKNNPTNSLRGTQAHARQIHTLLNTVRRGDLALVPRERGRIMMIGKVVSDGATVDGTEITTQVDWLDTNVPLGRFDQDLKYSFKAIHKFCQVSRNGAVKRIDLIAHGQDDPGWNE